MTKPTGTVLFTDDELVAAAVREERSWPTPLPSLPALNAETLRSAAARGWRSLAVRGLLDGDALAAQPRSLLTDAMTGSPRLRTCLLTSNAEIVATGSHTAFFATYSGDWLVDVVAPSGVHALEYLKVDDVEDLIRRSVDEAHERGIAVSEGWPTEVGLPKQLCVYGLRGDSRSELRVGKDEFELESPTKPAASSELSAAIDHLLDMAVGGRR